MKTDRNKKREFYIEKYKELKEIKRGEKPLRNEFLKFCHLHEINLTRVFGKDAYSTLQEACGDLPNKLQLQRTALSQILDQYGELARKHQRTPVTGDWLMEDFSPTPEGLRKVHKLSFLNLPEVFIENYKDKVEWLDVLKILKPKEDPFTAKEKKNKIFYEIVDKINKWNPDRKRVIEEGYKIELRKYLEKFYDVEEEIGESNVDLLINKKYPIELKKDPSLSEYDRLLGQMIRHNRQFGFSIAIITSISSEDRYKKFQKLFNEIHERLEMTAELINK